MGAEGAKEIATGLLRNHTLSKLDLGTFPSNASIIEDNQIGGEGAKAVSDAISQNRALCKLNLGLRSRITYI